MSCSWNGVVSALHPRLAGRLAIRGLSQANLLFTNSFHVSKCNEDESLDDSDASRHATIVVRLQMKWSEVSSDLLRKIHRRIMTANCAT
jgi:hypothetical protein